MRYGFIGLGHLGGHLAANLVKAGFPVTVHDRQQCLADTVLALGATWADSARQAAKGLTPSSPACPPRPYRKRC
jgi:3-hydroxyisobutyrate dehydrogenase